MSRLEEMKTLTRAAELVRREGVVRAVSALAVEAEGPDAALGELCDLHGPGRSGSRQAEVVALRGGAVTLMPYEGTLGIAGGWRVEATGERRKVPVGRPMLGRVIDGLGRPLDGRAAPAAPTRVTTRGVENAVDRPRITRPLETGIRAIDALLPIGVGQRMGIFAGSGVGKSTLLGRMAQHVKADANVIALIGERSREVREFIDRHLPPATLARSVVVAATADESALMRIQAAYTAVTLAESLRDEGLDVVLTLDSITRLAMARREVGIAAGEPPTARGYTPSVFAELPRLCERCGTSVRGGSISALFTVLVEGDDLDEPVADALRATLDGHIVLSRELAHRGHFPPIDVLRSVSRLMPDITTPIERALALRARAILAVLDRSRELVDIGAYVPGTNPALDAALAIEPELDALLRQEAAACARSDAIDALRAALGAST